MPDTSISRTLVKSPPELWSEVSDLAALAEHLGEFGEIAITRLEAGSTVAWEGETARGTVALEPTGWGTKVTLTARPAAGDAPAEPVRVAPEPDRPEPAPAPPPAPRRSWLRFWRRADAAPAPSPAAQPPSARAPEDPPTPFDRQATAVLSGALDALGVAHHQPFSRG